MAEYPNLLAGGVTNHAIPEPFELYAGESDIVTDQGIAGENIEQFRVLMRGAGGALVAWDGTAGTAVGIAAQAAANGETFPYFTGGVFNHEALVWPAAIDTIAERKTAFDRSNIGVRKLL